MRKGVKKRISRHMQELGCSNVDTYLQTLEKNPEIKENCRQLLTVSISRFFRDRSLWHILERDLLPAILAEGKEKIKIWSAGCARGEEPYSFRIMWDVLGKRADSMPELEIWATDMNREYLDRALTAAYSSSSLREVPEELRQVYFYQEKKGSHFYLEDFIKEDIIWKQVNLLSDDPPASDFRIIFLRNSLLTYYSDRLKIPALQKVAYCLAPGGFFIIGSHENIPRESAESLPSFHPPYIFQKKP